MIIKDFLDAMSEKDYKKLAACFGARCRLVDYCPAGVGLENFHIYGAHSIEMFYHNQFVLKGYAIFSPAILDERNATFYANYGDYILHVIATIESYDPASGLVQELVLRPA